MSLGLRSDLGSILLRTAFVLVLAVIAAPAEINTDIIENNLCGEHLFGEGESLGQRDLPEAKKKTTLL
jgi:hypothetical protein